MRASGNASGAIEAFNLGLLAQKGSLYATRPTLFTHIAKRADLEEVAGELFDVVAKRGGEDPRPPLAPNSPMRSMSTRALEGRETTGATVMSP